MKKHKMMSLLTVVGLIATLATAGVSLRQYGQFGKFRTQAGSTEVLEVVIPAQAGVIRIDSMYVDVATNADMKIYLPSKESELRLTPTTNSLQVHTGSTSNDIGGRTVATGDWLMLTDATNGYQLKQVTGIGLYVSTNYATTYTVDITNGTEAVAGSTVYLVDVSYGSEGDIVTFPAETSGQSDLRNIAVSRPNKPILFQSPLAAGRTIIGGTYGVWK